jgi:pimeloyl-ACP methyl ester carboxylesterase
MASISERESREIEAANASGTTPVVFIHGLWLLPSSWANWVDFFKQAGYAPLTPDWPDDPETVDEARANPDVLAKKTLKQVADHTADVIGKLEKKPAVMGHSTGGLFAQMLAGRGLWAATVAIDPGVFRGLLQAAEAQPERHRDQEDAQPDGQRQPQPLDRVKGRHEEPRSGPPADSRRGKGPHGSLGDRQR